MKEIKEGNVWRILYVLYAMNLIMNFFTAIKNKNIADLENCFWIINTTIMFACARMNEKRADKFQELYFDEVEKDFKEKVDKYMKGLKK